MVFPEQENIIRSDYLIKAKLKIKPETKGLTKVNLFLMKSIPKIVPFEVPI